MSEHVADRFLLHSWVLNTWTISSWLQSAGDQTSVCEPNKDPGDPQEGGKGGWSACEFRKQISCSSTLGASHFTVFIYLFTFSKKILTKCKLENRSLVFKTFWTAFRVYRWKTSIRATSSPTEPQNSGLWHRHHRKTKDNVPGLQTSTDESQTFWTSFMDWWDGPLPKNSLTPQKSFVWQVKYNSAKPTKKLIRSEEQKVLDWPGSSPDETWRNCLVDQRVTGLLWFFRSLSSNLRSSVSVHPMAWCSVTKNIFHVVQSRCKHLEEKVKRCSLVSDPDVFRWQWRGWKRPHR